ncbi:hypothetical protein ABQE01_12825 [Enterococcus thailandicus]|uniref:hypothetical protein n=1 Tax=Enterococcus thailandicus TaxID=417368 RepID=UPI0032E509FC
MRRSKYETHVKPYFDDIFYWYSHEWNLKQIAAELGVGRDTFLRYKQEQSDLSDLLKKAEKSRTKYIARKAEKALVDKLEDREVEETHTEIWKDDSGKTIKQHVKKIKKIIPADTTAIIFALKTNDKERYTNAIEHSKKLDLIDAQVRLAKAQLKQLDDGYDPSEEQTVIVDDIPLVESEVDSNGDDGQEETSSN